MITPRRPWGHYKILNKGAGWWVKQIYLKRNKRTSLQYHKHRGELHFVVSGEVMFTLPEQAYKKDWFVLRGGQSIWIPKGHLHRLQNVGKSHATIIEVAYGKPRETDIVRIADDYGRVGKNAKA